MVGPDADVLVHVEDDGVGPGHPGASRAPARATKASCELPVANMAWATPRASTAARRTSRASSAAARASAGRRGARARSPLPPASFPVARVQHARRSVGQTGLGARRRGPRARLHLEAAWKAVRRYLAVTPVVAAPQLGPSVSVKVETVQPTGSFKVRGGLAAVSATHEDEPGRAVVASSAGNHGLGRRLRGFQPRRAGDGRGADGRVGGEGLRPPAVRRAARPPRGGIPGSRDARARAGRARGQPLRVALQRPRRHRRVRRRWRASWPSRCRVWAPSSCRAAAAACWPA